MKIYDYTVLITPDVTGGYVVTCPALPGLVTQGETLEEARTNAVESIDLYLEVLREDGEPIPADVTPIIEPLKIKVA
ncbi:MAG TPA: type II toxin-antitoxin system HicB family antitoxin [Pyrinomonadaceae bacterium]